MEFHEVHFRRDYKEYNTDTTVKFQVMMQKDKFKKTELEGFHKVFKLQSTLTLTSMVKRSPSRPRLFSKESEKQIQLNRVFSQFNSALSIKMVYSENTIPPHKSWENSSIYVLSSMVGERNGWKVSLKLTLWNCRIKLGEYDLIFSLALHGPDQTNCSSSEHNSHSGSPQKIKP